MTRLPRRTGGVILTALLVATPLFASGCGGDDASPPPRAPAGRSSTTTTSATPETTAAAGSAAETPSQRCTGAPGPGRSVVIRHGDSTVTAAELGRGRTWAVLLHQSNGDGYCGWWNYATWLTRHGVHVLMFDLCDFGSSRCRGPFALDHPAQTSAVVERARRDGADRIVLVGASMGGAIAVASADTARVDAVVDLSGPPVWTGAELVTDARRLTIPTLLAVSHEDASYVPAFKRAVQEVPTRERRLVVEEGGHGYVMLGYPGGWKPLSHQVLRWIRAA